MKSFVKQSLIIVTMLFGTMGAWAQNPYAPTKQSDGTWKFRMSYGDRLLNVVMLDYCELAWENVPLGGVSGYLGFESRVTFPTLTNPHSVQVRYGSSDETVATIDENTGAVSFVATGTTVLYAVHAADNQYLYDSVYYTLTVATAPTLTLAATGNGTVAIALPLPDGVLSTATAGVYSVYPGTAVTVQATPASYCNLASWTPTHTLNAYDTAQVTVSSNTTLTATFAESVYDVTVVVTLDNLHGDAPMGSVSGPATLTHFTNADYTATANTGYHFSQWTDGNDDFLSTNATYHLSDLTGDYTLNANFAVNEYTIGASANPAGAGTIEGTGNYNHFESAELTATAGPSYYFVNWTNAAGTELGTSATLSFPVTGDSNITANFALKPTLTLLSNPAADGDVTIEGTHGGTSPWNTKVFDKCYSCLSTPTYPLAGNACFIDNIEDPYTGNYTSTGPWKLDFVGNYSYPDKTFNYDADGIYWMREEAYHLGDSDPIPMFRLSQWNSTTNVYDEAVYGVACAFVNDGTTHAAMLVDVEGHSFFLTDDATTNSLSVTFTEDLTTAVSTLVGATVTDLPAGVMEGNSPGTFIVDPGTTVTINANATEPYHLAGWSHTTSTDPEQTQVSEVLSEESCGAGGPSGAGQ